MSDQRQKRNFLSLLLSPRGSKSRPPPPNNAGLCGTPSGSASIPSRVPRSTEPLADSSRIPVTSADDSQIVDESYDQRPDRNTANQQRTISIFSGVEHMCINGGNFMLNVNNSNYRDNDHPLKSVAFQLLPRSHDAAFSAAIKFNNLTRRRCTEGTRVDIIAQIMAWVNENDLSKAPPVYWLTGLAGLGKTTIAYSICERLDNAQRPFASYFCSLQLDSWDPKLLVPTLCRELARLYKPYAASVLPILETNPKIVDAGLSIQIDQLLARPWQASVVQRKGSDIPTPIIVVDALDECDRGSEFLAELLRVIRASQLVGIKFLVTSRTDPKFVDICKSFPLNAVFKLHQDTANVQNDIKKYLQEALPELKDDPELVLLSQRAGGLFIYAATAVKFISPSHTSHSVSEMRFHLRAMLNPGLLTSHAESDERLLVDELYERILGVAFQSTWARDARLRILHTIVCAQSKTGISVLAELAETDEDTVERVVESLHAVLFVSPKDGCVYWYHASFREFVCSQTRAMINLSLDGRPLKFDAFCDEQAHHRVLAQQSLSIMHKSLHFNMCDLPSSYTFDSDVPGLKASVDSTFSPTLKYVLSHWAEHLFRAVPAENDNDVLLCSLKDFLDNNLLFWIEAMNLIDAKTKCFPLLRNAESWLEKGGKCQPDLLRQLADAMNFSTYFAGSPASKSTPHLYISALPMWNQDSPIWANWKDRFGSLPSLSSRGAMTIPLVNIHTTSSINCIAISSDGNQIVSCAYDSVRVWDAKTGDQLRELQGHTGSVNSVAFSRDGNRIISGSNDKSVRVWDAKTSEQLMVLEGHTSDVTSVAFSFDGDRIASGSLDKSVRLWDAQMGKQLRELRGHTSEVNSVAFSPDGNQIVSGSDEDPVQVWDAKTGKRVRELPGFLIISVAFSSDGNRIAYGSIHSVHMRDAKTGELLRELQGHTNTVMSVAFSSDGHRIVSGSGDKSVRVWDAGTGEQLRELQGHTSQVRSVAFSPDGNRVISGSWDKSVRVWDAKADEQPKLLQGHTDFVNSVAFSSDGNRIVSGSNDESVRVWDAKMGNLLRDLPGHTSYIDSVNSVAFSPNGNQIVSGSSDKSVQVWDIETGKRLRELQGHTDIVTSVAFSSDGNRVVSGSWDKSVRVWDAETGELLRELQGHTDHVTSVAFSPDGNRIVSGSFDNSMWVWDANTSEQLHELHGHTTDVQSVAFSFDGNRIVSGSYDGSVRLWDAKMGQQLKKLQGHNIGCTSVAFSPDGNQIVAGCHKLVRVWDATTGVRLRELRGHTDLVTSVAFSSDGDRIVSCSWDKSVRVWDNLNLEASWVVNEDGWILSGAERLVWVPSTICNNILLCPPNILIISPKGSATISFSQDKLGTSWHECYTGASTFNRRR